MRKYLPYFPIALCIVVCFVQIVFVAKFNISPWKMGGFGMFSRFQNRIVVVSAIKNESEIEKIIKVEYYDQNINIDHYNEKFIKKLVNFPTDYYLDEAYDILKNSKYTEETDRFNLISNTKAIFQIQGGTLVVPANIKLRERMLGKSLFKQINIRIWHGSFNGNTEKINYELLKEKFYKI